MARKKPCGKKEVTRALITAAADLFAKHGVDAVSIRQIAARAGVNHGLIHRHFGSKEELRKKTQEYLAAKVREEIGIPENFQDAMEKAFDTLQNQEKFWKVLARTLLDGRERDAVQDDFPFIKFLVQMVADEQENGHITAKLDPRYIVSASMAIGLGMLVFHKFILPASGLEDRHPMEIQMEMNSMLLSLVNADR